MDLQVYSSIGFGFCPPSTVNTSQEGGVELTYRYVPPQLFDNDERRIVGAFNAAAAAGALDDNHADLVELGAFQEAEHFTEKGEWLFSRMPIYAILRIEEPYVEWQAWWDNEPVVTLQAQQLEPLLEEGLKLPPQQLWAQRHLSSVSHYLFGVNDPEAVAMPMAPGLDADSAHSKDLPRVTVEERVEYPWGLWKVVLIAINDDAVANFAEWLESDQFSIIDGTVGILRGEAFEYAPVPFIRWELPATLVPSVVRWAEREQVRRDDPWAPIAVMPYYDWDSPVASIPIEPEAVVGLAAAYTIPVPPHSLENEFKSWMESEIRTQIAEGPNEG